MVRLGPGEALPHVVQDTYVYSQQECILTARETLPHVARHCRAVRLGGGGVDAEADVLVALQRLVVAVGHTVKRDVCPAGCLQGVYPTGAGCRAEGGGEGVLDPHCPAEVSDVIGTIPNRNMFEYVHTHTLAHHACHITTN